MPDSTACLLFRVNELPPVLLGLSLSELQLLLTLCAMVSTALCTGLFALIGHGYFGLVLSPVVMAVMVRQLAAVMRRCKLGKPAHYFPLLLRQRWERVLGKDINSVQGPWSILRRNRYEGAI